MSVRNLYDPKVSASILQRLENVQPGSVRKWGKMSPAQMFKHMNTAYRVAIGREKLPPHQPMAAIAANPLGRWLMIDVFPWPQGSPTAPEFIVKGDAEFDQEKVALKATIAEFLSTDPSIKGSHPIFGKMDKTGWGKLMYKHTDHHLRQFGC
jgi:hypothetical protein